MNIGEFEEEIYIPEPMKIPDVMPVEAPPLVPA